MSHARLVATPPAALGPWTPAPDFKEPVLSGGAGATFVQWDASHSPSGAMFVASCVATPIPGWVEDMRPAVEARAKGLLNATTDRAGSAPVASRSFIGWDDGAVVTCFALCAGSKESGCEGAVSTAKLEGTTTAPAPGLALGAITWAVHHPATTVTWAGVLTLLLGVVAVASRRRPRSRI